MHRVISLIKAIIQLTLGSKARVIKIKFVVGSKDFTARVPSDNIWGAVKDILLSREYEYFPEFELCNLTDSVVVDAGAHVGLYSLVASAFAKKVIAVEPSKTNYYLLKFNISANEVGNIVPLNKALYHTSGKARLFKGKQSGAHSLVRSLDRFECVETITLEQIMASIGHIDLLKFDIEGAEFDVFKHVDVAVLKRIKMVVGELHLQHGDIGLIVGKLKSAGFQVKVVLPPLKRSFSYRIKLCDMMRLKFLWNILYILPSMVGYKDKDRAILFAQQEEVITKSP